MVRFQRLADSADTAIHHVAWRDDIDACPGLRECLLHQYRNRFVIQDVAIRQRIRVKEPVLAMAGERVERHIGHDAQFGELLLQRSHHPGHKPVRVQGLPAVRRL